MVIFRHKTLCLIFLKCQKERIFSFLSTKKSLQYSYFSIASTSTEKEIVDENSDVYSPTFGKGLRIAVIGCSNVGKSALTNALIRAPICAVSKLNTTTSLTEEQCQLVVVDSPGLVSLSHAREVIGTHSEDRILTHPEKAIERSEQIIVVHDATSKGEYLQHRILYILHRYMHIPACLVISKIDLIENRADLLKLTEILTDGTIAGEKIQKKSIGLGIVGSIISKAKNEMDKYNLSDNNNEFLSLHPHTTKERDEHWYSLYNKILSKPLHKARWTDTRKLFKEQNGWPHFKAVFFTSAKTNEGIDVLRTYLREHSIDKKWSFSPQTVSKKNSRLLCAEHVRSALLDNCPPHIAYKLRVAVTEWEFDEQLPINEQILKVAVNVFCENEREARQVWYQMEEIENTICQQLQQLYCRNALFRLFIRVKDKGGIYQPDEKAEERKRLFKEEMRIKKEI